MPLRSRLRSPLPAVLCAALALVLTACAGTRPAVVEQAVVAAARHAETPYRAHVLDEPRSGTITIVPTHRNGALVVFLHGWGQTRLSILTHRTQANVSHALTAAGYTVLSADARANAWGDPASVAAYRARIDAAQRKYGLRDVFLMGASMGGLATMQLARTLPQVRAVVAWYPVCDLRTMRAARYRSTIASAWRGLSSQAVSPVAVGPKPMLVWASAGDTVVDARRNAAVCAAAARRAGAQVTYLRSTGEHGDPSNYVPAKVVDFFDQHRSPSA